MHELSVAQSLIEAASDAAAQAGGQRVTRIMTRIGPLSGIVPEALLFSFDLAAEGTLCAGARLEIENVAVTVMCPQCKAVQTLSDMRQFCCPTCGTPTPEILSGRELELHSIEIAPQQTA